MMFYSIRIGEARLCPFAPGGPKRRPDPPRSPDTKKPEGPRLGEGLSPDELARRSAKARGETAQQVEARRRAAQRSFDQIKNEKIKILVRELRRMTPMIDRSIDKTIASLEPFASDPEKQPKLDAIFTKVGSNTQQFTEILLGNFQIEGLTTRKVPPLSALKGPPFGLNDEELKVAEQIGNAFRTNLSEVIADLAKEPVTATISPEQQKKIDQVYGEFKKNFVGKGKPVPTDNDLKIYKGRLISLGFDIQEDENHKFIDGTAKITLYKSRETDSRLNKSEIAIRKFGGFMMQISGQLGRAFAMLNPPKNKPTPKKTVKKKPPPKLTPEQRKKTTKTSLARTMKDKGKSYAVMKTEKEGARDKAEKKHKDIMGEVRADRKTRTAKMALIQEKQDVLAAITETDPKKKAELEAPIVKEIQELQTAIEKLDTTLKEKEAKAAKALAEVKTAKTQLVALDEMVEEGKNEAKRLTKDFESTLKDLNVRTKKSPELAALLPLVQKGSKPFPIEFNLDTFRLEMEIDAGDKLRSLLVNKLKLNGSQFLSGDDKRVIDVPGLLKELKTRA